MAWPKGGSDMAEVTVTLKGGTGYDKPWIVVRGENAAETAKLVAETVGVSGEGLTLLELTHNAAQKFSGVSAAGTILGATVIPEGAPAQAPAPEPAAAPAIPAAPPVPNTEILAKIEAATSVAELGDVFMQNKGLFEANAELMAQVEAKSRTLA